MRNKKENVMNKPISLLFVFFISSVVPVYALPTVTIPDASFFLGLQQWPNGWNNTETGECPGCTRTRVWTGRCNTDLICVPDSRAPLITCREGAVGNGIFGECIGGPGAGCNVWEHSESNRNTYCDLDEVPHPQCKSCIPYTRE
jgi:hypothetical protein